MIKINLVREGRAVRGAGAPAAVPGAAAAGAGNLNNILIVALSIIGLVIALGYWFVAKRNLAEREATLEMRKSEAKKLEAAIKDVADFQKKKDNLQKRIDLINQLKQNQKGPVRIMDQVSRDLPDLVWLKDMTISGGKITLNGYGLNPNAVALFVANIKADPYFEEPQFGTLAQQSVTPPVYTFDLSFGFTYTPKNVLSGTPGVTSTGGPPGATGTAGTTGTAAATSTAAPGKKK